MKLLCRWEIVFKCLFFVYAAMSVNCVTFGKTIISFILWPTFLLGAVLLLNRTFRFAHYRSPYAWWLVVLLGAGGISILCNLRYDVKMNSLYWISWAFYFLLLYMQPRGRSVEAWKREARLFIELYTAVAHLCVIVSIGMLVSGYSLREPFEGGELLGGFVDSRLYGMFIDPNAGATTAATAAVFTVHAARLARRVWQRICLLLLAALDVFYVALSDSRTGMVVLFTAGFTYTLLLLLRQKRLARLTAVALALVVGLGCFGAPPLIKAGYNSAITRWATSRTQPSHDEKTQAMIDSLTVHRDYDLSGDISNRRFSVWRSGFEIFAERPLVGTTYTGFTPFAKQRLPDTYIVNNNYTDMITFDNEIINVMVSNGLLGLIPLLGFSACIAVFLLRRIAFLTEHDTDALPAAMFAAVCGIAVSALFRAAVLYYLSANSVLFWELLGILAVLCASAPPVSRKEGLR